MHTSVVGSYGRWLRIWRRQEPISLRPARLYEAQGLRDEAETARTMLYDMGNE